MHDKALRIETLATEIAPYLDGVNPEIAGRAARLAKADLVTGLVGEFPELQGIIGGYYAAASGEGTAVGNAITGHYRPQGPADNLPATPTAMVVALADKVDTLVGFFGINAKPTGSKDPFALRRAALGVIRIIVDGKLNLPLVICCKPLPRAMVLLRLNVDLLPFIRDRLRGYLRDQQMRHDVVAAALANADGDDIRLMAARATALAAFLAGSRWRWAHMAGWRRVSSILAAEEKGEQDFLSRHVIRPCSMILNRHYSHRYRQSPDNHAGVDAQLAALSSLRSPIDVFFDKIVVNDDDPEIRLNRLGLLAMIREKMLAVADFTKIEG